MTVDPIPGFFTATFRELKGSQSEGSTTFTVLEVEKKSQGLELERTLVLGARTRGRTRGRLDGTKAQIITDAKVLRTLSRGQELRFDWLTIQGRIMTNVIITVYKAPENDCS